MGMSSLRKIHDTRNAMAHEYVRHALLFGSKSSATKGRQKPMKTVTERPSFQGDVMIRRIDKLPPGLKPAVAEGGNHIIAHSETGHHHVVKERAAQLLIDETNAFIAYLDVAEPCELEHLRSFDTHESYLLEPGFYEVRRQREYVPEGWRRATD